MKQRMIPLAVLAAILAVVVMLPAPAAAQSSVAVTGQGVENRFPDGLRFYINAESASTIEEIRVYVRKLGQSSRSVYRAVEFEPGSSISGEAVFRSQTANEYIPPGTRLSYYFEIRTADGSALETDPETIVYLNRGLDWDVATAGLINVYYYHHDAQSESRANTVLEVADDTYALMGPLLGVELTEPMNIVVYSDYADMQMALPPKSRVAQQQLRTLGQAFINERALLVDGSNDLFFGDNTLSTAAHEFTHLLVADAAGSAYGQVHTWLNEGLAVYSERQENTEFGRYVSSAIRNDQVPPLSSLRTYSGTPIETLRNYGLGHAVVSFMLDAYGPEKMAELFAALRSTHNFEKALQASYGLTIPELDNQWRQSVGLAPRDLSTPPPPPLQALPTRRPTPTPTPAPTMASAPATTPADAPATAAPEARAAPTYTPRPRAEPSGAVAGPGPPGPPPGGGPAPRSGGCGAAPAGSVPAYLGSLAFLAWPVALIVLAGKRWRRK